MNGVWMADHRLLSAVQSRPRWHALSENLNIRVIPREDARSIGAPVHADVVIADRPFRLDPATAPWVKTVLWTGPWEDLPPLPASVTCAEVEGHEAGMAEMAVALTLCLTRNVSAGACAGKAGHLDPWRSGLRLGVELAGRTVSILGLGRVGREICRRLTPFDCDLIATRRRPDGYLRELLGLQDLAGPEGLSTLVEAADVLIICSALNRRTRGLIDRAALLRMRRTAYIVNVSRAEVIDERALAEALAGGQIAGFASDAPYPPHGPIEAAANRLVTPRLGLHTGSSLVRRADSLIDQLTSLVDGEPVSTVRERDPDAETQSV